MGGERLKAILSLLAALVLLAPFALADAREERQAYVWVPFGLNATAGFEGVLEETSTLCDANLAGACFALQPGDATVALRIEDVSGFGVGGLYAFKDAEGNNLGTHLFCGGASAPVPPGAAQVNVGVAGGLCAVPLAATTGTIVATFSG